jgi:hypothetical protein
MESKSFLENYSTAGMTTNISRNTTDRININKDMNAKNILNDFLNKNKMNNNFGINSENNKSKSNEINSVNLNNTKNKERFTEVKI